MKLVKSNFHSGTHNFTLCKQGIFLITRANDCNEQRMDDPKEGGLLTPCRCDWTTCQFCKITFRCVFIFAPTCQHITADFSIKICHCRQSKTWKRLRKKILNPALQYALQITGTNAEQLNVFNENALVKQ